MENKINENDLGRIEAEVVSPKESENVLLEREKNEALEIADGKINLRKGGNLVVGTINFVVNPVKKHLQERQEKFYKNSQFHFWVDLIFTLTILALVAGFILINNLEPKAEITLNSSFDSVKIISGEISSFTIEYGNNSKADIKNASLSLNFPKNFILTSVQPEKSFSDQANTFSLGDLNRGANGKVRVSGIFYGGIGEEKKITYSFNYYQKKNALNKLGYIIASVEDSALSVFLEIPKVIYKNLDLGGKIIIVNNSKINLNKNIELSFLNSDFKIVSISGDRATLLNGVAVWDGLKAGESAEIQFKAFHNFNEGNSDIKLLTNLDLDGYKARQAETVKQVIVFAPKLSMELSSDIKYLQGNNPINFKLALGNNEKEQISDIKIDFSADTNAVVLKKLELKNDKNYSFNGTIISAGNFNSGEKIELDIEAVLERKKVVPNQETGLLADVHYKMGEQEYNYKIYSNKIKILSDLQVSSRALYYSAQGDQLGVGPLPPIVDVPTKYWIFWEADNLGNDLKDFIMSADLPANVAWTGQKSLLNGKIRYAEISRKIVWTVDNLSGEGGQYRAGFEIELIPNDSNVGQVPNLLINTEYNAVDAYVDAEINGQVDSLNADLKGDNLASGKGKVIKMKIIK